MDLAVPLRSVPTLRNRTPSTTNPSLSLPLRFFSSFPSSRPLASLSNRGWFRCGFRTVRAMATDETAPNSGEKGDSFGQNEREVLLDDFNIKLESGETFSLFIYGIGALVVLWIMSVALVGALDSIPLLPKLMEVVGLGFSVWFSIRYLIFKESREELIVKVKDIKKLVMGPTEE